MKTGIFLTSLAVFLLISMGCSNENSETINPENVSFEQINYGSEMCDFSNEVIETVRYGGRLELEGEDVHNFMSVECLAGFYLKLQDKSRVNSLKVVDFAHGKRLLPVDDMVFLHSSLRPSPNGMYLTAIESANEKMVTNIYDAYPGPLLSWEEVLELIRDEWDLTEASASIQNF